MPDPLVEALAALPRRTFAIVAHLDDGQLERQIDPIMSPLVWDLGAHRGLRGPLARAPLRRRAAAAPRARRALRRLRDAARRARRDRAARRRRRARVPRRGPRAHAGRASTPRGVDPVVHEMVIRHELQHTETMRQAMRLGGLLAPGEPGACDLQRRRAVRMARRPRRAAPSGAADDVFAYDNERPRHGVELGAFRIARRPVTNATWLHFTEGGGYQRREWWSDEGWAWKEDYDISTVRTQRRDTRTLRCATSPGSRPTPSPARAEPGSPQKRSGRRRRPGPKETSRASDRSGSGPRRWFDGYPGFVAHPYREYSEVFFGAQYRVLRGGSWATRPARRHPHLPQLGPPPAPADLRRRPPRHRSEESR